MIRTGYFCKKRSKLLYLLLIGFLAIAVRLFYLQIISHEYYDELASKQHRITLPVMSERGTIFDRNGKILAESHLCHSLWGDPSKMHDKEKLIEFIIEASKVLGMSQKKIEMLCSRKNQFVWIKRQMKAYQSEALEDLVKKVPGIYLKKEWGRFYPAGSMLSPVLGIVGIDHQGLTGLEKKHERELKGLPGRKEVIRDRKSRVIYTRNLKEPVKGNNLSLTLDLSIQTFLHSKLYDSFKEFSPKSASGMILDVKTGEILALSTIPAHLPGNKLNHIKNLLPRMFSDTFEPGSTMKPLIYGAMLEHGLGKSSDIVYCGMGKMRFGRRYLHDVHGYGKLSFKDVIVKSSNIGAAQMGIRLGNKKLFNFLTGLEFGQKCNLPFYEESPGIVRPLSKWNRFSTLSIPMGHEMGVTMIQMLKAYAAVGNGGYLLQPFLEKRMVNASGEVIKEGFPVCLKKVLKKTTCQAVIDAMVGVVNQGTAKRAKSDIYQIAGKTGTTEKIIDGKYSKEKNIGSFICLAPAVRPKIAVMVIVDEPQGSSYGGVVAAPVAKKVVEDTLQYMGVESNTGS